MYIVVRYTDPENNEVEEVTYYPGEFNEIKTHPLFDEETSEIINAYPVWFDDLSLLDDLIRQVDAIGAGPVEAWIDHHHGYDGENIGDMYYGSYEIDDMEGFGRDMAEGHMATLEELAAFIDWDAYGRSIRSEYDMIEDVGEEVHVFEKW